MKYVKRAASKAIDEMKEQFEYVLKEPEIAYSKETEFIRRLESEQLKTVEDEKEDF